MTDQFRVIRLVACVIKVIDQSLKDWIDFLGAGPFHTFEYSQMDDQKYRRADSQAGRCFACCWEFWRCLDRIDLL